VEFVQLAGVCAWMDSTSSTETSRICVGTMGITSQRRSPGKKKMKQRRSKMNSFFKPNGVGSIQKPSVINGTKVCKGCILHLSVYKHGHDLTCPKSEYFGLDQKQKQDAIQEKRQIKALLIKTPPASDVPNTASKSVSIGDGRFFMQKKQHQATVLATMTIIPPSTGGTTTTIRHG
jgi:hypothetical protein